MAETGPVHANLTVQYATLKSMYTIRASILYILEMATGRAARGPGRAGPNRAVPENPGPRASRAQTGLKMFYVKVLCATENSNFC